MDAVVLQELQVLHRGCPFTAAIMTSSFQWGPIFTKGTAVAQWLRCYATIRKVAGSIPAGVIGFFIDIKSFR